MGCAAPRMSPGPAARVLLLDSAAQHTPCPPAISAPKNRRHRAGHGQRQEEPRASRRTQEEPKASGRTWCGERLGLHASDRSNREGGRRRAGAAGEKSEQQKQQKRQPERTKWPCTKHTTPAHTKKR